jgi:hypothetical protein
VRARMGPNVRASVSTLDRGERQGSFWADP